VLSILGDAQNIWAEQGVAQACAGARANASRANEFALRASPRWSRALSSMNHQTRERAR
jgi:hypothetical protein